MGSGSSRLEKALGEAPEGERYFGLENFGNTCYANSVLQTLYFCQPFRDRVLQYAESIANRSYEESLLTCLAELFVQISTHKRKTGILSPKRFINRLKRDNELFRGYMHQDAHEFLNYLLNQCSELLEKEQRDRLRASGKLLSDSGKLPPDSLAPTWIQDLFQGKLVNETRCLQCETTTSRQEAFFELSLDIEQNSSLSSCLRNFSAKETLDAQDKFFCDACQGLQEAQKCIRVKKCPRVLCCHLKRFKYVEQQDRLRKLMYRVTFPFDMKLPGDVEEGEDPEYLYLLKGVVVHVGSGPNHGHYVSYVNSHGNWLFFDDEDVQLQDEAQVQTAYGSSQEYATCMDHGYILIYERASRPPARSAQGSTGSAASQPPARSAQGSTNQNPAQTPMQSGSQADPEASQPPVDGLRNTSLQDQRPQNAEPLERKWSSGHKLPAMMGSGVS